jgi:hypothetical protein
VDAGGAASSRNPRETNASRLVGIGHGAAMLEAEEQQPMESMDVGPWTGLWERSAGIKPIGAQLAHGTAIIATTKRHTIAAVIRLATELAVLPRLMLQV